ncbi:hypothetical protein E2I00_004900, partial [Balaenoptera physalus]
SKSWGDMEKKLRDIVTNSAISGRLKEACAWSSLALAVRFAKRQKSEDAEKIKKLQDQLEEQKLLTKALRGTVGTRGEEKEKEAQTSGLPTYSHGTADCWLRGKAGKGSDQETAALPEMAAVGGEAKKEKVISQWGNDEGEQELTLQQPLL